MHPSLPISFLSVTLGIGLVGSVLSVLYVIIY
uniref:Uncharacterized protein n=1 Tax=Rhizophora mucronata TaxID=61149 RepID=A0A2P2PQW6_RHIMU